MRELPVVPDRNPKRGRGRFLVLAAGLGVAGIAGYLGYAVYPRFDLPRATGVGLWLLAAAAGTAAFFSPCSFPLLLTLLSRRVDAAPAGRRGRVATAFAASFALGAALFLAIAGLALGAGAGAALGSVTFTSGTGIAIRITVGSLLILLGLIQAEVLPLSFHAVEGAVRPVSAAVARVRRSHPAAGTMAFGFAYLLIGFG
jgi:cytochrome c biogenesis protein CcdA